MFHMSMRCSAMLKPLLWALLLARTVAGRIPEFHLPQLLSTTGLSNPHRLPFEQYAISHPESQKAAQAQLRYAATAKSKTIKSNPAVQSDARIFPPPTNHIEGLEVVYKRQCHSSSITEMSPGMHSGARSESSHRSHRLLVTGPRQPSNRHAATPPSVTLSAVCSMCQPCAAPPATSSLLRCVVGRVWEARAPALRGRRRRSTAGMLLAVWFEGTEENAPDVSIMAARHVRGEWHAPFEVVPPLQR